MKLHPSMAGSAAFWSALLWTAVSSGKEIFADGANSTTPADAPAAAPAAAPAPAGASTGTEFVVDDTDNDNTEFMHFVAHNKTHSCSADVHARPFNNQIRGVNLGGWLVLEPWITPSLFYQFLGQNETQTAFDIYTFCQVLGPKEGNKQLKRHWDTWVTEDIIQRLADSGTVNSLRLPVGDWMYKPYGPYIGCTDGALDYVDLLLDWAYSRGLSVLIDIHGLRDSQNGFDNSGQSMGFRWTSQFNQYPAGLVTFEHWPIREARWVGTFDRTNANYSSINYENIQHGLDVIQEVVDTYSGHPAVLGLEPVNEPWEFTPIDVLKQFYWDGYLIVKKGAPYWKYIMHDSFRFGVEIWGGFMRGCPDRALDTHIYQAWMEPANRIAFYTNACSQKLAIAAMERAFGPVVVGEWSLATDNCAMWLNGFNDNLPGFPRLPCKYVPCSDPYMGTEQPGTPVDPGKPVLGPYGSGMSGPMYGLCPVGRDWLKESSGDIEGGTDWMRAPPEAPPHRDDSDRVMTALAYKKINAFSGIGHGYYFWNFRTDVEEPHWSYLLALERGWIPRGDLHGDKITSACHKEDNGEFLCVASRTGQLPKNTRQGMKYCLNVEGTNNQTYVDNLEGDALYDEADRLFNDFWQKHRAEGATCDFGGAAQLVEINRTATEDDEYYDDDWYGYSEGNHLNLLEIIGIMIVGIVVGGLFGFFLALRMSKKFRRRVSSSTILRPVRKSQVFRKLGGYNDDDYEYMEIPEGHMS